MAVWSAVPISALEYSRIDADFYHPTYLKELGFWRRLEQHVGASRLGRLIAAPVRTGRTPRSRSIKGDEKCIRFIKTDTVREGTIDFNNSALLPARVVGERDIIPADAVVMTIIGATPEIVGRVAIVRPDDPECVTNQNVAIISTNGRCDPYFLTAYFQTKWGRDQVWRHSRRTEQVNLNCREVERILVPNPAPDSQYAIGNLVREAFAASDRSVVLYQQAQQLLEAELGLDKLTFEKPVGYTARLSEATASGRIDADYFQTPFRQIDKHLDKYTTAKLDTLVDITKGIEVGSAAYQASGHPFLRVSNVKETGIEIGPSDKYISPALYSRLQDYRPQVGELLLTKDGSPGVAMSVDQDCDGIISGGIVRLKPKNSNVPNEYVALAINSHACRMQVERECSGALILHWKPASIRKLRIPILAEPIMRQIADLVIEAKLARRESVRLLEQAKARVEQLIEEAVQP
jgi:restriction endonuclease S subunit